VPVPVPARLTVSTAGLEIALKLAVTCSLAARVNVQVRLVPLQLPVHPAKVEFAPTVAVRVTWVPLVKLALQAVPQLIPEGVLAMVPVPVPPRLTVSTTGFGTVLKLAVTC
jgi:hypothetical protein